MELLTAWRDWECNSPPYLLSDDDDALISTPTQVAKHSSWESFIGEKDFGAPRDIRFHLGLVPVPFTGNVERAKVIILLLNPGLEPNDYFGEYRVPGFRDQLIRNLRQDFSHTEYPFLYLDPAISWHSGYRWWHGKFQGVIAELAKNHWGVSYRDARRHFANLVACLELVPYHSVSYSLSDKIRGKLRSARIACEYAHEVLRPRAERGEVLIVVTRGKEWRLAASSHVIVYSGAETRAAHLTPNSRGGREIVKFVRRDAPTKVAANASEA